MKSRFIDRLSKKWTLLEKKLLPDYVWRSDPLTFWRERILFTICFITAVLGPLALIPSVWLSYYERLWGVLIIDLAAYIAVVIVLAIRNTSLIFRAGIVFVTLYALGIYILFALGPVGAGYLWLFGASVLISATIGLNAAFFTLGLNFFTLVFIGIFIHYGHPFWALHLENAIEKWFVMAVNFILLNSLVTITTALMLDGLQNALGKEQEASAGLKESERKYRLLAANTIDCIWTMDLETVFTYVNPAVEAMLGYTPEEWVGSKLSDHCDEKNYQKMLGQITGVMEALPEISATTFEAVMYNKQGRPVDLEIIGRIVLDTDGKPAHLQGVTRNITERKQFEARLQQAQKHEAIGTLAGGIAHDFNNILSAIIGYTELAMDDVAPDSLIADNLREVFTAGKRAKELVGQILTFARQTEGENKPVQIGMIAKEVLKLLRSTVPTTIELIADIQSTGLVMADPTHIHQLLMNLCTNAAQAMDEDGGKLTIILSDITLDANALKWEDEISSGHYIKLDIADTGSGIAPDVIDKIFDPYFTTKGQGEGTGMGLAVVHGIVKKCNGKITVNSRPRKGSTFTIYLPAARKSTLSDTFPEQHLETGNERILFVDDEPAIVEMSRQVLQKLGYAVTTRTSSMEALELFQAKPFDFDLIITDMTMPNMTGDKLILAIRDIRPDIKAILCTGYSKKIETAELGGMRIDALIHKPIVRSEIARIVREVLDAPPG